MKRLCDMELIESGISKKIYKEKVKVKEYPRFDVYAVYIVETRMTRDGTETRRKSAYQECENKIRMQSIKRNYKTKYE